MSLMTASGGLSNGKLELATATPDQVLEGSTFYAGDRVLKTGTMPDNKPIYKVVSNLNFAGSITITVTDILPDYYSYTSDNFIVVLKSGKSGQYGEVTGRVIWAGYSYPDVTYNPSTGTLTLKGYGPSIMYSGGVYNGGGSVVDVYAAKRIQDISKQSARIAVSGL